MQILGSHLNCYGSGKNRVSESLVTDRHITVSWELIEGPAFYICVCTHEHGHKLTGAHVLSLIHTSHTFLMYKVCMHQVLVFQATKDVGVKLPLGEGVLEPKN